MLQFSDIVKVCYINGLTQHQWTNCCTADILPNISSWQVVINNAKAFMQSCERWKAYCINQVKGKIQVRKFLDLTINKSQLTSFYLMLFVYGIERVWGNEKMWTLSMCIRWHLTSDIDPTTYLDQFFIQFKVGILAEFSGQSMEMKCKMFCKRKYRRTKLLCIHL